MRFCCGIGWLAPVIQLKRNLDARIIEDRTGIETDQLLIEVSTELNNIIERATATDQEQENSEHEINDGL